MAVITLSASYGAGGSRIGPALAERVGATFVERAIPTGVAERLAVPLAEAERRHEAVSPLLDRLLGALSPMGQLYGAPPPEDPPLDDHAYRTAAEAVIGDHAERGDVVILGRAAMVVLAGRPGVLRVRLDGPREARIAQAVALGETTRDVAERLCDETDAARDAYVSRFYGADAHDCRLYHLVLDSTAIGLETCVELIATAAGQVPAVG